jgi:type II secretory pathway component PulF
MPQFSYSAVDASGRTVQGVLDAATENDLIVRLSTQGLRVQTLSRQVGAPHPQQPVARPMTPARPATSPAAQPQIVRAPNPQNPTVNTSPAARHALRPKLKLRPSTEAETYFFFTQLSNLLRSGVSTTEALTTIADRSRNPEQQKAFRFMAQLTATGSTLADAMAQFDELFPPGAVGAVRAGETGGYAWEACSMVGEHANQSLKLRRFYWWLSFVFWSSVLSLPFLGVAAGAIDRMVQAIDNGKVPLQELGMGLLQGMVGPWGLLTIAVCVLFWALNRIMRRAKYREFRHNVAMKVPLLRKRTEGENFAAFNTHLSKLGRAGISPYTSWKLAAAAVPNQAFSERLVHAGSTMHENTKLSQVMYTSHLFPQEFGPLVETGEIAGSLPQALEQAAEVGRGQAQHAETGLKWRAGCWVFLITLLASGLFFAVPYRALYESVFKHVMGEP